MNALRGALYAIISTHMKRLSESRVIFAKNSYVTLAIEVLTWLTRLQAANSEAFKVYIKTILMTQQRRWSYRKRSLQHLHLVLDVFLRDVSRRE